MQKSLKSDKVRKGGPTQEYWEASDRHFKKIPGQIKRPPDRLGVHKENQPASFWRAVCVTSLFWEGLMHLWLPFGSQPLVCLTLKMGHFLSVSIDRFFCIHLLFLFFYSGSGFEWQEGKLGRGRGKACCVCIQGSRITHLTFASIRSLWKVHCWCLRGCSLLF